MKEKHLAIGRKLFTGFGLLQTLFVVVFMAMLAGYYTSAYNLTANPEIIQAQSSKCDLDKMN